MVFSSIEFIFYFLPAALALYLLGGRTQNLKYFIIIVLSGVFIWLGDPQWSIVLAATTLIAFAIIQFNLRPLSLLVLLPLIAFKYNTGFGLFPDNPMAGVALPLGISFYSFHLYSMIEDYWAGRFRFESKGPLKFNPLKLGAYVAFFPQLIAGPILRYKRFHNQTLKNRHIEAGVTLFCLGLFKKVVIADSFALVADKVYATSPEILNAPIMWAGAIAYHLQIYFDFCGYSEMAIGLGLMFGIRLPRNFKFPYAARSMTDFWRRWHITLSRFFRDYLYFRLGGNRRGGFATYRNLFIVFFVTGAWHGNTMNFILWGLLHGGMLIVERATHGLPERWRALRLPGLGLLYVNLLVILFWVPFRAPTLDDTLDRWSLMAQLPQVADFPKVLDFVDPLHAWLLPVAALLAAPTWLANFGIRSLPFSRTGSALGIAVFIISIVFIVGRGYSPFIYFRF